MVVQCLVIGTDGNERVELFVDVRQSVERFNALTEEGETVKIFAGDL